MNSICLKVRMVITKISKLEDSLKKYFKPLFGPMCRTKYGQIRPSQYIYYSYLIVILLI